MIVSSRSYMQVKWIFAFVRRNFIFHNPVYNLYITLYNLHKDCYINAIYVVCKPSVLIPNHIYDHNYLNIITNNWVYLHIVIYGNWIPALEWYLGCFTKYGHRIIFAHLVQNTTLWWKPLALLVFKLLNSEGCFICWSWFK